jgi:D-xylonolactonase
MITSSTPVAADPVATAPTSLCPVGATLGEGPVWSEIEQSVWFVDIKQHRVHRYTPEWGVLRSWNTPAQPGWILPTTTGDYLMGMQDGVHRFDPVSSTFTLIAIPEAERPGNRLNDATVGADGTLWFGSMDDAEIESSGHVYRLKDGALHRTAIAPVEIVNGPALSPDGGTLYHVDTLGRTIWAVPLDANGHTGTPTIFAQIEDGAGYPDGPTVDAEGHVWIGLFGGWAARRYAPGGQLVQTVQFPVANVTKIAFGGDGYRTAFATTARKGLDETELAAQPLAGDLFAFEPGIAGLPVHAVNV